MISFFAVRAIGTGIIALVGWQFGSVIGTGSTQPRNAFVGVLVGAASGFAAAPLLVTRPYSALRRHVSGMPLADLLLACIGLVLGLVVSALLAYPLSFLPWWFGRVLPAGIAMVCGYLGVTLALMRRSELSKLLHTTRAGSETIGLQGGDHVLVDTSAIIDGRIVDIAETGFLRTQLVIPRFVLQELQHIADAGDPLRRSRGRRGLEMLGRLQKDPAADLVIADMDARDESDVDGKLVLLARRHGYPILTNDFNLNRVAELEGVMVLNVNKLANALKPFVLPGEEMCVHVIQEGKECDQGVAYLDDGTMIVVENGRRFLENDVHIVVSRVLQTVAGRMIFAQVKGNGHK